MKNFCATSTRIFISEVAHSSIITISSIFFVIWSLKSWKSDEKVKSGKRLRDWKHFTMDFSGNEQLKIVYKISILIGSEILTQLKTAFVLQSFIDEKFSSNQVRKLFCDFFKILKVHGPRITSTQKLSLSCTWQLLLPVIISKRMCPWSTKS